MQLSQLPSAGATQFIRCFCLKATISHEWMISACPLPVRVRTAWKTISAMPVPLHIDATVPGHSSMFWQIFSLASSLNVLHACCTYFSKTVPL